MAARPGRSISTSKCPELARTAPSFISRKCSGASTSRSPVRVMNTSPSRAASAMGSTRNPSITDLGAVHARLRATIGSGSDTVRKSIAQAFVQELMVESRGPHPAELAGAGRDARWNVAEAPLRDSPKDRFVQ